MSRLITLIRCNLINQTRNYRFFMIIGISVFLGFLCVPSSSAGYEIFYFGGVRGVYNSAWLGVMGAMLPVILLWLPGFFLLRSQITVDAELKIGQIIASAPVSKLQYILGKFITNFSVLMVLQLIFLISLIIMQFIQRESMTLSPMGYIKPLIFITVPYLLVLAALTILFDVIPFLRGAFGNIVIFVLWIVLSSLSVASPNNHLDLFGIGVLLNAMMDGARVYFPNLLDAASFGYYTTSADTGTFVFDGVLWSIEFVLSRFIWIIVALVITRVSAVIFNRFKETSYNTRIKENNTSPQPVIKNHCLGSTTILSTVEKRKVVNLPQIIWRELKIMLFGHSLWWYLSLLAIIVLTPFVSSGESVKWISLSILLPMSIWSQMGNRDKSCGTTEFVTSSCSLISKWIATWLSGVIVAILVSLGMFVRIAILSEWNFLLPWVAGMIFIPSLALVLGSMSGGRRLFEAVFIALVYFGGINNIWKFDFMGLSSNNSIVYIIITLILLCIGIVIQLLKEKRLMGIWR